MRILVVLPLVLLACDSGGGEASPLVGTWQATASQRETVATSTVNQSVPDFSVEGTGGITVSGAVSDRLSFVSFLVRVNQTETIEFSSVRNPQDASGVVSVLGVVQNEGRLDRVSLNRFGETPDTYLYQGTAADPLALTYANGAVTLTPTTLPAVDGSGVQVTVGGRLTFPLRALSAGREAVVRVESAEADDYSITFDEAGTFRVTSGGERFPASGTWRTEGGETLVLSGLGAVARIPYTLAGGQLQISASLADYVCDAFCRDDLEGSLFAQPGSLTNVQVVQTDTFQRTGG